jgi:hypothetical protein
MTTRKAWQATPANLATLAAEGYGWAIILKDEIRIMTGGTKGDCLGRTLADADKLFIKEKKKPVTVIDLKTMETIYSLAA